MMCESSCFASVGKWYRKLAGSSLAYLVCLLAQHSLGCRSVDTSLGLRDCTGDITDSTERGR